MDGNDAASPAGKSPAAEELSQQLERISRSAGFSNAGVLRSLLTHLVKSEAEEPGRHIKEYEIATEVLGRGPDFDPRLDSTVRVHTGRLRSKLAEYYSGPGIHDPIRISIPKGAYHVAYDVRGLPPLAELPPEPEPRVSRPRAARIAFAWLGWLLALAAVVYWIRTPRAGAPLPDEVSRFWRAVTHEGGGAVLVFSNPLFTGTATGGMRYTSPGATPPPKELHDRYTGIGEAMAVHELTRLFDQAGLSMHVKRSQLLTWDEARDRNLIFVGGPDTNHPQRELPRLQRFAFKTVGEEPQPEIGAVVNLQPLPGEENYYYSSGAPYTRDYAVIGFVPGLDGIHKALILAGTTTYGTQGAAEFLLAPENVKALLDKLSPRDSSHVPYFEALVRIKVSGGVPVQPELVLLRPRT